MKLNYSLCISTSYVLFKDCTVRSWDLSSGQELAKVNDHRDYVQVLQRNKKIYEKTHGLRISCLFIISFQNINEEFKS